MWPRRCVKLCLVLTTVFVCVHSKSLPSYLNVCKRSSPALGACLKNATVAVRSRIAAGIPQLNIPSVEPLTITSVQLEEGTDAINFKANFQNMKIFGLSDYFFTELSASNKLIQGKVNLAGLYLESDYELTGRILLLPIRGKGLFTANFTDTTAEMSLHMGIETHRGKEYFRTEKAAVKLTIDKVKVHFGNLFDGDQAVSAATNMFLNENSRDIVQEVLPAVEAVVERFVGNIARNVFRSLPNDKLFPQ